MTDDTIEEIIPEVKKPKAAAKPRAKRTSVPSVTNVQNPKSTKTNTVVDALAENTSAMTTPVSDKKEKATMVDNLKKALTVISNNRETIKRKLIVGVGTAVGMLIASSVIDRLNEKQEPEIIYVEIPVKVAPEPEDAPETSTEA